jgi:hypothetical protein
MPFDRGSIFRNFMKQLNSLGDPKWDISNPKDEKHAYEVMERDPAMASTLQSFEYRQSRGFQRRTKP